MDNKQKVIERLKGKTIKDYYDDCGNAENIFMEELEELDNFGSDCNCDCKEIAKIIHEGNSFDEIVEYCLGCGGYKRCI